MCDLSVWISDDEDIVFRSRDFLKKANLLFYNFKFCSPSTLTFLLCSFCLSSYGCVLWRLNSEAITSIDLRSSFKQSPKTDLESSF